MPDLTKRQWDFINSNHPMCLPPYFGRDFDLISKIKYLSPLNIRVIELELRIGTGEYESSRTLITADPVDGTTHIPDNFKTALREMWDFHNLYGNI